jgi:hypothetical protein
MKRKELKEQMLTHEYKNELFLLLESKLADKYAAYVSIRKDLEFVKKSLGYLIEIEKSDGRPIKEISGKLHIKEHDEFLHCLTQSIYFASVITYGKCFASAEGRKTKLERKDILIDASESVRGSHDQIIEIRNQYVAHGGVSDNEITMVKLLFSQEGGMVKPNIAYSGASAMSERKEDMESFASLVAFVHGVVVKKISVLAQKLLDEAGSQGIPNLYMKALEEQQRYLIKGASDKVD